MGAKETYCMFMSIAGCLYFIFITFACFVNMEVLKLKEGTRVSRGFAAFFVAIVIIIYIIFIFFNRFMEELLDIFIIKRKMKKKDLKYFII